MATTTALVGGIVKGLAFDRPRIAMALPNARAQGQTVKWLAEMVTGQATNDIVPIAGGTVKIGSKVLTQQAWKRSYQVSNALTLALVGANMVYGIPNLIDGLRNGDGVDGLLETRAGRTGVMASLLGLAEIGLFSFAFARSGGNGAQRLMGAMHHPIHSQTAVVAPKILAGIPVILNEFGFLDFLNRGSEATWLENAKSTIGGHVATVQGVLGRD